MWFTLSVVGLTLPLFMTTTTTFSGANEVCQHRRGDSEGRFDSMRSYGHALSFVGLMANWLLCVLNDYGTPLRLLEKTSVQTKKLDLRCAFLSTNRWMIFATPFSFFVGRGVLFHPFFLFSIDTQMDDFFLLVLF
jgi:hypothetical protein